MRRKDSQCYRRKCPEAKQSIDVSVEHLPRDNSNAAAAIYPWLKVDIPEVNEFVIEMTDGDKALLLPNAATLSQPIEFTSPKGIGARWYLYQPDSVPVVVRKFVEFSQRWVFPFLDAYCDPAGIVKLFRARDERVLTDEMQLLRVAAAMVLTGEIAAAREMLAGRFSRPGPRRRYGKVFEFLENYPAQK